jgi:hypothetical protein
MAELSFREVNIMASEVIEVVNNIASAVESNRKNLDKRLDEFGERIERIEAVRDLPKGTTGKPDTPKRWGVSIEGKTVPILSKSERLTDHFPTDDSGWSLGAFVKASMGLGGKSAVERGEATVPNFVSARIIDAVREKARVVQAGASTIPIEGPTTLARIDGDPTVYVHTEGATDISESVPVFAPVSLDPKALVALVPLTAEIVEDSPNLDAALSMSLGAAFALKLDQLAIAAILAHASIPTSASGEATDSWVGTMAAIASALSEDQDVPRAIIANAADYAARHAERIDIDVGVSGAWLGTPGLLSNTLDLPTTGVDAGTAILGDFARGVGIASRMGFRTEVVRWAKSTSATHVLVAYARLGPYVLQPGALYVQKASV